MMNLVSGALALLVFGAFVVGLAQSIHAWPFWIIVVAVLAMALWDFWESVKVGRDGGDTTALSE
ncbi:MAG: hypothetical protein ACPGNT_08960 [Rhodospirillales bacterium]